MNTANRPPAATSGDQGEVIAFLRDPLSHGPGVREVGEIETHGALVFLAGQDVYKIKKAVRLAYLDFSTLARRRRACLREIEINRPAAPMIYRDALPITREKDGRIAFAGKGRVIEWAVHMTRFEQDRILDRLAGCGPLPDRLAEGLADRVARWHRRVGPVRVEDGDLRMKAIVDNLAARFGAARDTPAVAGAGQLAERLERQWHRVRGLLAERGANGHVRRCHGDLHLNNIVVIDDQPVLFDAIEFDETLATIDVLYDLAFLLMDLGRARQRRAASRVFNRYLQRAGDLDDLRGLAALPLFLACRAGVRAMVALDRAAQERAGRRDEARRAARGYLEAARDFLNPEPALLVAIGGFSGTGKTTLARSLAPLLMQGPGALHLRSDVERKMLAGVDEFTRLDAAHYTDRSSVDVYERLALKAKTALGAGHRVIVDAVFSARGERDRMAAVAREAGAAFTGLWLTTGRDELVRRVAARRADASDATARVVRAQIARGAGAVSWREIDAGGDARDTLERAAAALAIPGPARSGR